MSTDEASIFHLPQLRAHWRNLFEGDAAVPHDELFAMWSGLGLNVLEVNRFLFTTRPSFQEFERWVLQTNGGSMDEAELERLKRALSGQSVQSAAGSLADVEGLSSEDLQHWNEYGYVVLRNAITAEDASTAAHEVYEHLSAAPGNAETWYGNEQGQSIWVRTVRNPAFRANRRAPRIVKAFAQLWGREDLWPTIDQGGLNPPERPGWTFPGPHLHWDYSLAEPHTLDVQGLLYLTDTPAHQGAFQCVPGFQKTLPAWLAKLDSGISPRDEILNHPGAVAVPGCAGDLVLWNAMLPHGASPNRGEVPRVVQYLSMRPTQWEQADTWL